MTSPISQNTGVVAAKMVQSIANPQSGQGAQAPNSSQLAQASQVAAERESAKVELSSKKTIQRPKRTEGTFNPEANEEKADSTDEKVRSKSESAYQSVGQRGPLDVVV